MARFRTSRDVRSSGTGGRRQKAQWSRLPPEVGPSQAAALWGWCIGRKTDQMIYGYALSHCCASENERSGVARKIGRATAGGIHHSDESEGAAAENHQKGAVTAASIIGEGRRCVDPDRRRCRCGAVLRLAAALKSLDDDHTGGASGIGRGTVELFVKEGASVVAAILQDGRSSARSSRSLVAMCKLCAL